MLLFLHCITTVILDGRPDGVYIVYTVSLEIATASLLDSSSAQFRSNKELEVPKYSNHC